MSLTSTVPAAVPSLFHSSLPAASWVALKRQVPLTSVRLRGMALAAPGTMSLTRTVPAGGAVALPQLVPVVPSLAEEQRAVDVRQVARGEEEAPG